MGQGEVVMAEEEEEEEEEKECLVKAQSKEKGAAGREKKVQCFWFLFRPFFFKNYLESEGRENKFPVAVTSR